LQSRSLRVRIEPLDVTGSPEKSGAWRSRECERIINHDGFRNERGAGGDQFMVKAGRLGK
jgi:hypothetical protein